MIRAYPVSPTSKQCTWLHKTELITSHMKAWKARSNKKDSSATLVMQKVDKINEQHYTQYAPTLGWCNLNSSNTSDGPDPQPTETIYHMTLSQPMLIKYTFILSLQWLPSKTLYHTNFLCTFCFPHLSYSDLHMWNMWNMANIT